MSGIWVYDILNPKKSSMYVVIITHLINSIAIFLSYFIIRFIMTIKLIFFGTIKLHLKDLLWKENPLKIDQEDFYETDNHRYEI